MRLVPSLLAMGALTVLALTGVAVTPAGATACSDAQHALAAAAADDQNATAVLDRDLGATPPDQALIAADRDRQRATRVTLEKARLAVSQACTTSSTSTPPGTASTPGAPASPSPAPPGNGYSQIGPDNVPRGGASAGGGPAE